MTEYGRGTGPQPWHPEDPLYGDLGWNGDGAPRQQGGWDAHGHQQSPYPQQQDAYGTWQDPPPGLAEPYGQGYAQQPPQPYGDHPNSPDYTAYYPAPDAYPPPQPQHTRPPGPYGPDPADAPYSPQAGPATGWDPGPDQGEHAFFAAGEDDSGAVAAPDTETHPEPGTGTERSGPPGGGPPGADADGSEPPTRAGRRAAARGGKGRRGGARRRNRAACLIVAVVLVGGGAGATYAAYSFYQSRFASAPDYSGTGTGEVTVEIPQGAIAADMAKILAGEDVVKSEAAFIEASDENKASRSIQPGIYTLRKQMSAAEAIKLMLDPASQTGLIIPEGLRATQIYQLIDEQTGSPEGTTEELAQSADLGLPAWAGGKIEGFLFPSRYSVSQDSDPQTVLKNMVGRAKDEFDSVNLESEAAKLDRTPYEILIIASLIQAEAQEADDFGKVSQVIYNRLQPDNTETNGKLDFDSTINYALGRSTLDVSVEDTGLDDPFNTYRNPGLPPTPIDNPGHQAIEAALHPTEGPWYYFVTVKPGDTRFTETYKEHQEHVKDFNAEQAKKREEREEEDGA
ncbi:endolytic transglycosylase MltG [Streptomyces sp. JJ66]|uniref:endolytic transglycosylase MltG n=1 Tax=Streptomyces sp. JJ66 TaxID=2803843 RepID=UPI001C593B49|nr:endolytic transglycosylase MltG [Streptomyces sp. JJ66]MBW1604148.1 endolytic transglycosylase MltG [Streptomyces sp. JJ66]